MVWIRVYRRRALKFRFVAFLIFVIAFKAYAEDLDGNCVNLLKSLHSCNKYACKSSAGIGFYVFGYKDSGECNYVQVSNEKDFMSCELPREDMHVISDYISKLLSEDSSLGNNEQILNNVVAAFTKDCNFFDKGITVDQNSMEGHIANELEYPEVNSYRDADNTIKDVRSLFFTNAEIAFLNSVFKDAGKSEMLYFASVDRSSISNQIRLDSILYISPYIWKIWVNGALFQGDGNLKIAKVEKDRVMFSYALRDNKADISNNNEKVFVDKNNNIHFMLEVSQSFYPDSMTVK